MILASQWIVFVNLSNQIWLVSIGLLSPLIVTNDASYSLGNNSILFAKTLYGLWLQPHLLAKPIKL